MISNDKTSIGISISLDKLQRSRLHLHLSTVAFQWSARYLKNYLSYFSLVGEVLFQTMRTFPLCTVKPTGQKEKQDRGGSTVNSPKVGLNSHIFKFCSCELYCVMIKVFSPQ